MAKTKLSDLIITQNQRIILIIDEIGLEKISQKILCQVLNEQGQAESTIKTLLVDNNLKGDDAIPNFLNDCSNLPPSTSPEKGDINANKWNILLPPLSDFINFQKPWNIFHMLQKLKRSQHIQRVFLWASSQHVMHEHAAYIIGACEYMSDLIWLIRNDADTVITTRQPGGGITIQDFKYKRNKLDFLLEPVDNKTNEKDAEPIVKTEASETFKIGLEEEEIVARNALKLPYEKTSEETGGNIIYTPDDNDDFDEEDPDEDLCI